jgi:hypothetical protein
MALGGMREIMKTAVDRLYAFLVMKHCDHTAYEALLTLGERYTTAVGRTGFYQELLNGFPHTALATRIMIGSDAR